MKRFYSAALLLTLSVFAANAKVVKTFEISTMDKSKTLSELIPESEKYSVDSICVTGYFDKSNFLYLRDLTINGNLTGIDLRGTEILEIPDLTFGNTKVNVSDGSGLSKLQYIRLPYTLRSIGYRAFCQSSLRSITIPKVYEIKEEAFASCSELHEVVISSYVPPRTGSSNAFHNISSDAVLYVPSDSKAKYSSLAAYSGFKAINEKGGLYNIRGYYLNGTPLKELLGDDALTVDSIVIGGRITEEDVETLSHSVCYGRLSGIDMDNCSFPDNEIPEEAFTDYPGINYWPTHLNNVSLPYGIERIGLGAFGGSFLYALSIPSSVKTLGTGCFKNATINGDLVIPEGVRGIEKFAFDGSVVTGNVYIPSTLNKVGSNCFAIALYTEDIDRPKNFYCNRMTPPEYVSENASYGNLFPRKLESAKNWTLYVPKGAKDSFAANKTWGQFPNIIETSALDGGTSGIANAVLTEEQTTAKRIYTLDGRYVGTGMGRLGSGIYVVDGKKVIK